AAGKFRVNGRAVKRGQIITVDGTTGRVILGAAKLVAPKVGKEFDRLMAWADAKRRLRVRANADIPADARRAREFGAEGIGLCRTEHMFFEGDRITLMREVLVRARRAGPYLIGTVIELPRAAVTADEIAKEAEFFSFGTNDLTQTTFGLSRDDAGRFLPFYVEHGLLPDDPFQVLDQGGVG